MRLDEVEAFRKMHDNIGIYTTAYRYDNPNQNEANLLGDFYLDFDTNGLAEAETADKAFQTIKEDAMYAMAMLTAVFHIPEAHIQIYFSGKKGFHIIVPSVVFGVTPNPNLNDIYKTLAMDLKNCSKHKTIDTGIYDKVRLLRLPGSIHEDTGLYKTPITYGELCTLSLDQIKELAQEPREFIPTTPAYNAKAHRMFQEVMRKWEEDRKKTFRTEKGEVKLDFTPPCTEYLLNNPAPEGRRNRTLAVLVSYCRQRGYSEEETLERLRQWNQEQCMPKINDRELKTTVRSVYNARHTYGCSTLKEMGECEPSKCRFGKSTKGDRANARS